MVRRKSPNRSIRIGAYNIIGRPEAPYDVVQNLKFSS